MATFAQALQAWQIFYAAVAAACATLTGLLFVSVSITPALQSREENEALMRTARQAFSDFLFGLMIAFVFLVPHPVPLSFAAALLALGLAMGVRLARLVAATLGHARSRLGAGDLLRLFALPVVAVLGLIGVAVSVLAGEYNTLYWLVAVIAALVASASGKAWTLLLHARGLER